MLKQLKNFGFLAAMLLIFAGTASAATQTLTILGGNGVQGDPDTYTEYSRDGGVTWNQAFLTGWHPWGFLPGTNSWINFDRSPFVGLNSTTLYRVRFNVPAGATNPTANIQMKADNQADVALNGVPVGNIVGQGSANADLAFASTVHPGVNEITIKLIDWGGWVGFNYRIDLTVQAASPLTTAPAISGSVNRTPWEMNRGGSWSPIAALSSHGQISAYDNAAIPATGDANWGPAPDPNVIGFSEASIIPGGRCLIAVDYTYFQTFVNVPVNTTVSQFTIDFSGIDDGGRVTIFNSAYPSGVVVPGSYVFLGGTGTANLASYVTIGQNRIVVTQVDDCPVGNNLRVAKVILNGQPIQPPAPVPTNQSPVANAGAAQTVESTGATTAVTLNGSASSDPDGDPLTYAWSWTGGSATGVSPTVNLVNGTYNITLTVDDGQGHTATATTTVTVQDTTAPAISIAPIPVTEATSVSGASVNVASYVTTSDVCAVSLGISPAGPYALGNTSVTATATDCAANGSSATANVTVVDTTAPVLTVPGNVSVEANAVLSAVAIGTATATDIFAVTVSNDAPATYALGTTVVTWTATDANGNSTTLQQSVTVVDTTAPTATAQLIPVASSLDDDEHGHKDEHRSKGLFKVVFTATDIADPNLTVVATLNGETVINGQIVELKRSKKSKSEFEHGKLEIKGMSFSLDVTATDASGNVGTAAASYAFPSHKDHGIHRGNDKEDRHADSGKHKSEGKAKIEHKNKKKSRKHD